MWQHIHCVSEKKRGVELATFLNFCFTR